MCISLQDSGNYDEEVGIFIWRENYLFCVFESIIIAATVSFWILYKCNIFSVFPFCMKSNVFEKSTKRRVASIVFTRAPSMIRGIVTTCDVWNLYWTISSNAILIYPMNFLDYGFNSMKNKSIIKLSNHCRVPPGRFSVIPRLLYLGKWRMQRFIPHSVVFCLYTTLQNRRSLSSNFLVFQTSRNIFSMPAVFMSLSNIRFFHYWVKFFLRKPS